MTTLDDAIAQMMEFGLDVDFPECDGRIKRVKYLHERCKSGWYSLNVIDGLVCGTYGSWKVRAEGFKIIRRVTSIGIDAKKIKELKEKIRIQCLRKNEEIKRKQEEVSVQARQIWENSNENGFSEYAKRKQIDTKGARFHGKNLILPLYNQNGEMRSLQAIKPDGFKKYMAGGEVAGCFMLIEGAGPIAITEGYATGASIHMATGYNVAVCFSASNLLKVAPYFRKKRCIVCADDDFKNEFNVGEKYGLLAAKEINCRFVKPIFKNDRFTDFNDLHVLEGLETVREQCSI